MKEDKDVLDFAVVGMGPSGLYSAWRLLTAPPDTPLQGKPARQITLGLFDTLGESEVGGRLCTQPLPGYPFLSELGGMRFRSNQLIVNGLVDALDLRQSVQPFEFDQHFYFLREQCLRSHQFRSPSIYSLPYRLHGDEEGKLPHELIEHAIHKTLASLVFGRAFNRSAAATRWGVNRDVLIDKLQTPEGIYSLTLREWAAVQRYGEYRSEDYLFDVGFWDLLQYQLSPGAWHLAHDGLGYESIMGNWNAAVAIPWFLTDFTPSAKTETLRDGMSTIPHTLYNRIRQRPNVRLHHGFDLGSVDLAPELGDDGQRLLRLTFNEDDNRTEIVHARNVILALPKGALVRLDYDAKLLDQISVPDEGLVKRTWFQDLLHSVDGRALFKLFLGYSEPWWRDTEAWSPAGQAAQIDGKSNTDLPLRQAYYFGPERWHKERQERLGIPADAQHSMIMASYTDSHYIEFWTELAKDELDPPAAEEILPEDRGAFKFLAPRRMISRAEHQLGLLHGIKLPKPADVGLYMEWSRAPFYAGWHSWKVGAKPWEVSRRVMKPFSSANVFVCGEAYSTEQGWTEGALKSAERLLTQIFHVPLPPAIDDRLKHDRKSILDYVGALDD